MSAWIEIYKDQVAFRNLNVALYMSAWINMTIWEVSRCCFFVLFKVN